MSAFWLGQCKRAQKLLFFSFAALLVFYFLFHACRCENAPLWFKKGVFAEYYFSRFPAIRQYDGNVGGGSSNYPGFLRWEAVDYDGETARLNITLYRDWSKKPVLNWQCYVNVSSRDVKTLDGVSVGKTYLWLPPHLKNGDELPFIGKEPEIIMGKVTEQDGTVRTSQGFQPNFEVSTPIETIGDRIITGKLAIADFDEDTGIWVDGGLNYDGALAAMNIRGLVGWGTMQLWDTNIDLGPGVLTTAILTFLLWDAPYIIPLTVLVSVFSFLLWKRRKAKRCRQGLLKRELAKT